MRVINSVNVGIYVKINTRHKFKNLGVKLSRPEKIKHCWAETRARLALQRFDELRDGSAKVIRCDVNRGETIKETNRS